MIKMFGFNKKDQMIDTTKLIPETKSFFGLKKEKSIFKVKIHGKDEIEQALYLFRDIKFNDSLKFLLYRILTSGERANVLIGGPKGTAKTAYLEAIATHCRDVIYINAKTTIAGLVQAIRENPNVKIFLVDEGDKILDKGEKDDIRGFLSTGRLSRKLKSGDVEIEIQNLITIVTANNIEKFDGPFLSRFTEFHLSEYTHEEFKEICAFRMPEYDQEMIAEIAQLLIDNNMKDVQNMVKLRSMIRPTDSLQTVEMILNTVIQYATTSTKNVNWDKK